MVSLIVNLLLSTRSRDRISIKLQLKMKEVFQGSGIYCYSSQRCAKWEEYVNLAVDIFFSKEVLRMSCARGLNKGRKLKDTVPLCQPIVEAIVEPAEESEDGDSELELVQRPMKIRKPNPYVDSEAVEADPSSGGEESGEPEMEEEGAEEASHDEEILVPSSDLDAENDMANASQAGPATPDNGGDEQGKEEPNEIDDFPPQQVPPSVGNDAEGAASAATASQRNPISNLERLKKANKASKEGIADLEKFKTKVTDNRRLLLLIKREIQSWTRIKNDTQGKPELEMAFKAWLTQHYDVDCPEIERAETRAEQYRNGLREAEMHLEFLHEYLEEQKKEGRHLDTKLDEMFGKRPSVTSHLF
ncbi:uncharacterized protein [Montipora capricornis]|uniref:uncharacterized protein isoform X1 n=1 Tax=Montipora capricornis TaxID=246305 RepID=UPI0035F1EA16